MKLQKYKKFNNLKNDLSKQTDIESYIKDPDIGTKVKRVLRLKHKKSSSRISKKT